MNHTINKFALVIVTFLGLISCASQHTTPDKNPCYIVFDAGSSGTRLYIYEQADSTLISHSGPKVSALADPIRSIRGKTPKDINAITDDVIATLELIKRDGPLIDGQPKWTGFDWRKQCNLMSARVYATAGMRIAEQNNPIESIGLWQLLKSKLIAMVGPDVPVETRTLTGYEEGLFAWLSVKDLHPSTDYGIIEVGGASSQITFPCPECDATEDAVKTVMVDGQPIQVYSYSYLGLGLDEAPRTLPNTYVDPVPNACAHGAGQNDVGWTVASCEDEILLTTKKGSGEIKDPYNYSKTGIKGTTNILPVAMKNISTWSLAGAFNYTKKTDINNYCVNKNEEYYNPDIACFKPIYLSKYLKTLNVPPEKSEKTDISWTLGAAICEIENCLANIALPPVCRWMESECLTH